MRERAGEDYCKPRRGGSDTSGHTKGDKSGDLCVGEAGTHWKGGAAVFHKPIDGGSDMGGDTRRNNAGNRRVSVPREWERTLISRSTGDIIQAKI